MDPEVQKQVDALKKSIEDLKKSLEGTSIETDVAKSIEDFRAKLEALDTSATKEKLKELGEEFTDLSKVINSTLKPYEQFDRALRNNIQTFTGVTDASDTLIGSFFKLSNEAGNTKEAFEQAKETIGSTLNTLDVGVSIVRKSVEMSVLLSAQINKETAAFNAATGAGGQYNAQLRAGEVANREFGISLAEIAQARATLMDGLSGYGVMQEDEQMALTELTAQYGKLGVSTGDFAGILQTSTKVLGQSTAQTEEAIEQTRLLAQGIGISLPKALNDLNATLPQLAAFGSEATEIFHSLQKQSQATGLEVSELISISDGFMTFEAASRAAGNLNAVLRGQFFDTMSLLEAQLGGPDSFIETLRDQLQAAAVDFETLDRFEVQAIARAGNMSEAQLSALMRNQSNVTEQTKLQTDFNEALAAGRSLFDELAIAAKQVAVSLATPMELLQKLVQGINFLLEKIPDGTKAAMAVMGGATLALSTAKKMLGFGPPVKVHVTNPGSLGGGGVEDEFFDNFDGGGKKRRSLSKTRLSPGMATGLGLAGGLAGSYISGDEAGTGSARDRLGGAVGGAATGAAIGSFVPVIGTAAGAILGGLGGALGFFEEGGGIAGSGPTPIMAHGGEVVVPVQQTPAAENLANMVAQESGGSNQAVVAAIQGLGTKIDSLMQRLGAPGDFVLNVDKREFARLTNEHFGAPGSSPVSGV